MCGVSQMGCPPHRWAILEEFRDVRGNPLIKWICMDCRITIIKEDKNGKNKKLGKKD